MSCWPGRTIGGNLHDERFSVSKKKLLNFASRLFDCLEGAIITADKKWNITIWNQGAEDLYGITAAQALGRPLSGVITFEEPQTTWPEVDVYLRENECWQAESRHRADNGRHVWVDCLVRRLTIDNLGLDGYVCLAKDITERKQAKEALRFTQFTVDRAPIAIFWANPEGRFIYVNEEACRNLGYSHGELIGMTLRDLQTEGARKDWLPFWRELKENRVLQNESVLRRNDGESIPVEISSYYLEFLGQEYNCAFVHDISLRKQAEQSLQQQHHHLEELVRERTAELQLINEKLTREINEHKKTARHLRSSEERLRTLFRATPIPTYIWKKEGDDFTLKDYNDAAILITKGKIENYIGVKAAQLYSDQPEIISAMQKCFNDKTILNQDLLYRFQSTGETRQLSTSYSYVPPDSILVHTEDITERKKALSALQESEKRHRNIFETSTDAIMLLDETGFFDCNEATLSILGLEKKEDLVGLHPSLISPPTQPDGIDSHVAASENIQEALKNGANKFEWIHRRRNGEDFHAEVWLTAFWLGNRKVLQATVRDITAQKEAEEQIQYSEETARALMNATNDNALLVDREGCILALNEVAAKALAVEPNEAIGKCVYDYLEPDKAEERKKWAGQVIKTGKPLHFQSKIKGSQFDSTIYPVVDQTGKVSRLAMYDHDITELIRIEVELRAALTKAKEAEMLKSSFLSHLSHEIRTPLNHIIGLSSLIRLEKKLPDEETTKYLQIIQRSGDSLLNIINTVLDLSKIETGRMEITEKPFDLRQLIQNAHDQFQPQARAKSVRLTCSIADDVPAGVLGDPLMLESILNNFLGNAVKFTHEGKIELSAALRADGGESAEIHFQVRDSGIGIPQEQYEKIFESFYQIDGSTTREYIGTGLGLTIARELVHLLGGKVWVDSEVGVGTAFHFTCKFKKAET